MRLLITRLVRVLPMRCLEVSAIEANKRFPTVLDVRSDTVTKPTEQMLNAMRDAEVGDNVFRDDPTVIRLEKRAAEILGKESALFVTSGTQGNLLALLSHCWGRGLDAIVGKKSHIYIYEQGGAAHLGGIQLKTIDNQADGSFDLDTLEHMISDDSDPHCTKTSLVCLENTQNVCGGVVLEKSFIDNVCAVSSKYGIPVHMDGARLFNASVACGTSAAELVEHCTTVSICLSKGLGAPVGSLLCGPSTIIDRARRLSKSLGGGMRQCGILAAAGLIALSWGVERLHIDHENAALFSQEVSKLRNVRINKDLVQSNLVYFHIDLPSCSDDDFVKRLAFEKTDAINYSVLLDCYSTRLFRAAFNHHVTSDDVHLMIKKIDHIINGN